jgi:secreted trypsin-like serine protease
MFLRSQTASTGNPSSSHNARPQSPSRRFLSIAALLSGFTLSVLAQGCGETLETDTVMRGIVNGTDDTQNRYPNVGAMVVYMNGQWTALCSGTLVSPTVFLTAAHCTGYVVQNNLLPAYVSFDPLSINGTTPFLPATVYHNPGYNSSMSDSQDVAAMVLATPITNIQPAQLPTANLYDTTDLHSAEFVAVGYGGNYRTTGGGSGNYWNYDGTRRYASQSYRNIHDAWIYLSQNDSQGNGGTCYGDSGGPNFIGQGNVIAGITVKGDSACRSTNDIYRMDIANARNFLSQFMALP